MRNMSMVMDRIYYTGIMTNFHIFDGNADEFDTRAPAEVHSWFEVGTALRWIEFAGQLMRPLPVLAA